MGPAFPAVSSNIRLFFAVLPPHEASPAIERLGLCLQQAHHLRGHRIGRDRLHLTLAPVFASGRSLADTVARAKSVAAGIAYGRFPVSLEWSESFRLRRSHHPFVLRGDGGVRSLAEMRREIRAQMVRAGFSVETSFTPHVTLLWADRAVEANPIAPIHWTVRDFALVLSVVGQSRHIHVGRWPLQ
jgi:RNA 2',3'-cyclic 3'-phosphodiesterase